MTKLLREHRAKFSFAIGTSSIVPGSSGREHFLIADIDDKEELNNAIADLVKIGIQNIHWQETTHGFHIFTDYQSNFKEICSILASIFAVDRKWLSIGRKRGYLFLADKDLLILPWKVTRMILRRKEYTNGKR